MLAHGTQQDTNMRYFNKVTNTEAIEGLHSIALPDVVELDDSNPFFSSLPEGQQLTYDGGGIPNGLEAIPPFVPTTEQQAVIDLNAAGVTVNTVEAALYLDHRGNSAPITAIDASIDAVVISSGLTLSTVSNLI